MKTTGAELLLRKMAVFFAGDISEDLRREEIEREHLGLRPGDLTAYHESGHGALLLCFGFGVPELRLLDHPRVNGICLSQPWDGQINLDELPDDTYQANQIFISLHVCGFIVSMPRLKRVVRRLLKKHWFQIKQVAEGLLKNENKILDAQEIPAILAVRMGPAHSPAQTAPAE